MTGQDFIEETEKSLGRLAGQAVILLVWAITLPALFAVSVVTLIFIAMLFGLHV